MRYTCHPVVIEKLIEREVSQLRNLINRYIKHKIVIFAAGNYGQIFYSSLKYNFGVEAEFFIDNNQNIARGIDSYIV